MAGDVHTAPPKSMLTYLQGCREALARTHHVVTMGDVTYSNIWGSQGPSPKCVNVNIFLLQL